MFTEPSDFNAAELIVLRQIARESVMCTARLFQRHCFGARWMRAPYMPVITHALDKVRTGEIKRLLINIPPGFGKTWLAVNYFSVNGFLNNPRSRFLHSSFSDMLVKRNSSDIRRVIMSPMYQRFQPMEIMRDTNSKNRWANKAGGEFFATPAGGQATGFRAGQMDPADASELLYVDGEFVFSNPDEYQAGQNERGTFSGAALFDDMNKPSEVMSQRIRDEINFNFSNTFIPSRLAHSDVPVVVIAQRVHELDLSGYLLRGGTGEQWHHIRIPAKVSAHPEPYPAKYTHGIEIPTGLAPGMIWPYKMNEKELAKIAEKNQFVYAGQYMQDPSDIGSQIFPRSYWPRHTGNLDKFRSQIDGIQIRQLVAFCDTAMKTGQMHDFSVAQIWAKGENGKIYLIDQIRGKWEAPELLRRFAAFFSSWVFERGKSNLALRKISIEDKASGTGLIQALNEEIGRGKLHLPRVVGIPRHTDKVARAAVASPYVSRGDVVIPEKAPWIEEFLSECEQFTPNMTHAHDDQIDPMLDAVHELLISSGGIDYIEAVGR